MPLLLNGQDIKRFSRWAIGLWVASTALFLGFIGLLAYVAVHFLRRVW